MGHPGIKIPKVFIGNLYYKKVAEADARLVQTMGPQLEGRTLALDNTSATGLFVALRKVFPEKGEEHCSHTLILVTVYDGPSGLRVRFYRRRSEHPCALGVYGHRNRHPVCIASCNRSRSSVLLHKSCSGLYRFQSSLRAFHSSIHHGLILAP